MPCQQDFGKALLRGMGWQEGKQDIAPIEHVKRPMRLGLGAEPALGSDKKGGEVFYKDGVQKHVRRVGEKTSVQDRRVEGREGTSVRLCARL